MDKKTVYSILGVVGRITASTKKMNQLENRIGRIEFSEHISNSSKEGYSNITNYFYNYFLSNEDFDTLEDIFEVEIGFPGQKTVTIFEPFTQNKKWLDSFELLLPKEDRENGKLCSISRTDKESNLIVENEFKDLIKETDDIPKNSISLLLYNNLKQKHNTKEFLIEVVERQWLHNSLGTKSNNNGKLILVSQRKDLEKNLQYIRKHFEVHEKDSFKPNSKKSSIVLFLTLKEKPDEESEINEYSNTLEKIGELESVSLGLWANQIPIIPIETMLENQTRVKRSINNVSNNNSNWDWVKTMTETKSNESQEIVKPTPLKTGEVANIIASGMIDGTMEKGTSAEHVVSGGVKEKRKIEYFKEENNKGVLVQKIEITEYTEPYLNILISEDGKAKIKELYGEGELM